MSVFTMSLQEAIEAHGRDNIGLDEYPVIDEGYRTRINDLIIDQYLNWELGYETFSLWRHAMRRKMSQIMPTYNELYRTKTLIVDPMRTIDLKTLTVTDENESANTDSDSSSIGSNDTAVTSGSTSRQVGSDAPQVYLSGNGDYASNASDGRSDATARTDISQTETVTSGTESERTGHNVMDSSTTGYQGLPSDMLQAYRATIINIDMMIVNEVETLFMGIFNSGDSYFDRRYI